MEGIDRTALAPADAARVHESDEPETTPLTSTVDDAERAAASPNPSIRAAWPPCSLACCWPCSSARCPRR